MSISREESIKIISLFRDEWAKNSKCPNAHALDKAISDMQKLEKIEQMMGFNWCENCEFRYTEDECNGCSLIKIRQIIKE